MQVMVDDARRGAVAPDRSLEQRREALARANEVRVYRAQVKRDLKRRRIGVASLISQPPAELATMKVIDLLLAVPKIGRVKALKVLRREAISPSKTVGGLSERQRGALLSALR